MPNLIILQEFWYNLTDNQRNIILTNCHTEYNNFLQGKPFNPELINKYLKVDDGSFIHHAKEGNLELVKIYVQLGANIHTNNDEALIGASRNNHTEVVNYLRELGANTHAKNCQTLMYLLPHISITILLLLYSIVYIAIILH